MFASRETTEIHAHARGTHTERTSACIGTVGKLNHSSKSANTSLSPFCTRSRTRAQMRVVHNVRHRATAGACSSGRAQAHSRAELCPVRAALDCHTCHSCSCVARPWDSLKRSDLRARTRTSSSRWPSFATISCRLPPLADAPDESIIRLRAGFPPRHSDEWREGSFPGKIKLCTAPGRHVPLRHTRPVQNLVRFGNGSDHTGAKTTVNSLLVIFFVKMQRFNIEFSKLRPR